MGYSSGGCRGATLAQGGFQQRERAIAILGVKEAEALLIAYARRMPQAWEDHPWDHTVLKVGKKVFVFFGGAAAPMDELSVTVKLPISSEMALTLPYMSPAGHGLGRSGWVSLRQRSGDEIELDSIKAWILQSYRAVAPKRISKMLDEEIARDRS